jgi:histidine phosphotransferase ChpT
MSAPVELDSLDLAALISSRLCHDVISPVGAIVNGLEVLEEEKDPAMREIALDLVRKSAEQASARLQFARLAFGAAGSAGAQIDIGDAEQVARGFVRDAKAEMSWSAPRVLLPKNKVKLLLNLLVIAMGTVPRGGTVVVTVEGNEPDTLLKIVTTGPMLRIPNGVVDLIAGQPEDGRVDAHVIQPFYTGLIARAANMAVSIEMQGETVVLQARSATS